MKEYEENIRELKQDLRDKEEIINQFHESPDFSRLIDISKDMDDDWDSFSANYLSQDGIGDLSRNEENNKLGFPNNAFDPVGHITDILQTSMQKNEDLKKSLDLSHRKLSSIQIKQEQDTEKIEDLENDVEILKKHVLVLEREKNDVEKKYKNVQFKVQGMKNQIQQYKDDWGMIREFFSNIIFMKYEKCYE